MMRRPDAYSVETVRVGLGVSSAKNSCVKKPLDHERATVSAAADRIGR